MRINDEQAAPLRVAFETLGCRSNYADTVDLQAGLIERGGVPCPFDSAADVYVINTCTVTDAADKTALKLIRRAKSCAPHARIVVTGCMAEVGADKLESLRLADVVIGPGRRRAVLDAIFSGVTGSLNGGAPVNVESYADGRRRKKTAVWRADSLSDPLPIYTPGPGSEFGELTSRARYHLRIQEGCENSCSFCIIPQSRGGLNSRPMELILQDIEKLSALGYREIVLTGTHIGGYGVDLGTSFLELVRCIERAGSAARIRVSSIDPNDLTPEMVELIAGSNTFCHHLHICVQAFSDPILKRMNRRYRMADVRSLVGTIIERIPRVGLGSDVIAGFPGESREDVEQAIAEFLDLPFSYLHVFPYSEREGTAAVNLDGNVPPSERKRRVGRWRALSERKRCEFLSKFIGRELEAVIETREDGFVYGTSREYASIKAPLRRPYADEQAAGSLVRFIGKEVDSVNGLLICE